MSEWSPEDAMLLGLTSDPVTGVPYIQTGESPYYVAFRRMMERVSRVAERGNDLRVYRDGALAIGVRGGRCRIGGASLEVSASAGVAVADDATTRVWIDDQGQVRAEVADFPAVRSTHLRLAEVVASGGAIAAIHDLRGETQLSVEAPDSLGFVATGEEIDRALSGIDASVTAAALNTLCGGPSSSADNEHTHIQSQFDLDGEYAFTIRNHDPGSSSSVALVMSLPGRFPEATRLRMLAEDGSLQQEVDGECYGVVGGVPIQHVVAGPVAQNIGPVVIGVAPCDGEVDGLVLSVGRNLQSSDPGDHVLADVYINGTLVSDQSARLGVTDGTGYRCTDHGDGDAAVLFGGSFCEVARGDQIGVSLTRVVNGVVSQEVEDVAFLVVMRSRRAI